jgi:hypothetical protein
LRLIDFCITQLYDREKQKRRRRSNPTKENAIQAFSTLGFTGYGAGCSHQLTVKPTAYFCKVATKAGAARLS